MKGEIEIGLQSKEKEKEKAEHIIFYFLIGKC
jgi:hypothetical protein